MNTYNTIDRLGYIRAQIADLQEQAKALEAELKNTGPGSYEGNLFRATVSDVERKLTDWKAIAAKFEPSRQLIQAHTKLSHSITVRVTARKRAAA